LWGGGVLERKRKQWQLWSPFCVISVAKKKKKVTTIVVVFFCGWCYREKEEGNDNCHCLFLGGVVEKKKKVTTIVITFFND